MTVRSGTNAANKTKNDSLLVTVYSFPANPSPLLVSSPVSLVKDGQASSQEPKTGILLVMIIVGHDLGHDHDPDGYVVSLVFLVKDGLPIGQSSGVQVRYLVEVDNFDGETCMCLSRK